MFLRIEYRGLPREAWGLGGTKVGARVGSFDAHDGWAQHGSRCDDWDVALSLERQQSHSDPDRIIRTDGQTVTDQNMHTHASLAPGPLSTPHKLFDGHLELVHDHWTLRQWALSVDEFGLGLADTKVLSPESRETGTTFLTDITYRNAESIADWDLTARFSYLNIQDDSFVMSYPRGAVLSIGRDGSIGGGGGPGAEHQVLFPDGALTDRSTTDRQGSIELSGVYTGFNKHSLRVGTGFRYLEEQTTFRANFGLGAIDPKQTVVDGTLKEIPQGPLANASRQVSFAYLQDEWAFARNWELTAGVRYDHYSDFGGSFNPRAAIVWQTTPDLTTKFLYGSAFRAPSFSELRSTQYNMMGATSENLKKETIQTFELAFDYRPTPALRTGLNLFYYDTNGLIEVGTGAGGGAALSNSLHLRGYGVEVEGEWNISESLRLSGSFSYQNSKNTATGLRNADVPAMKLYLNPHWKFLPHWSLDAQLFWIGDREHLSGDPRSNPKDYTLVNVTLRRKNLLKHWDVALSVRNVFDVQAVETIPPGTSNEYPLPGRSVYGEIRYTF